MRRNAADSSQAMGTRRPPVLAVQVGGARYDRLVGSNRTAIVVPDPRRATGGWIPRFLRGQSQHCKVYGSSRERTEGAAEDLGIANAEKLGSAGLLSRVPRAPPSIKLQVVVVIGSYMYGR